MSRIPNQEVAERLDEVAEILEAQGANPYRVQAYRRAAAMIRGLPTPVAEILAREGVDGLDKLPGIGVSLAYLIRDVVLTGRLPMLERLRGENDPVALLTSVPGIGKRTAERLHNEMGVDTLEQLEVAVHDRDVAQKLHLGEKRLKGIRDSLAQRLSGQGEAPPVAEILDVDREYREKAEAGTLHRITPRRNNPRGEAWLPVLHTHKSDRHYNALYSNTPRAHEQGMTRDWVVIYYDGDHREHQCTVITSRFGPLAGRRIVLSREGECAAYYAQLGEDSASPP